MMEAQRDLTISYWFSFSALVYMGLEFIAIPCTIICQTITCCSGRRSSYYEDDTYIRYDGVTPESSKEQLTDLSPNSYPPQGVNPDVPPNQYYNYPGGVNPDLPPPNYR